MYQFHKLLVVLWHLSAFSVNLTLASKEKNKERQLEEVNVRINLK